MLGRKNRFNYRKLNPHNLVGDSLTAENPLIDFVKNNITSWPFVLLKHHLPMDFEKYGVQQPTYINVIRDPSDWFQSHYYFERFGWTRKEDDRGSFIGSEEDKMRVRNFPRVPNRYTPNRYVLPFFGKFLKIVN